MMHQELVEKRRWISEHRFLHALNYTMVLPGPEAQQPATYIPEHARFKWVRAIAFGVIGLAIWGVIMTVLTIQHGFAAGARRGRCRGNAADGKLAQLSPSTVRFCPVYNYRDLNNTSRNGVTAVSAHNRRHLAFFRVNRAWPH